MRISSLAVMVLILCLSAPASAQRTITINVGDLFKRKADKPNAVAAQSAEEGLNARAAAMGFELWNLARPAQPYFGKCYHDGTCVSSRITAISPGSGEEVSPNELLLQVDSDVTTEDENGRVSKATKHTTTVRCSLQRPLIEGYDVEFFARGQPNSSGTLAEEYLLVCHSFDGEAADGARRYGYPLVP